MGENTAATILFIHRWLLDFNGFSFQPLAVHAIRWLFGSPLLRTQWRGSVCLITDAEGSSNKTRGA